MRRFAITVFLLASLAAHGEPGVERAGNICVESENTLFPVTAPLRIEAWHIDKTGEWYSLYDSVEASGKGMFLKSNRLEYNPEKDEIHASEGLQYQDMSICIDASSGHFQLAEASANIQTLRFALPGRSGKGLAASMMHQSEITLLNGVRYTSCNPEKPAWQIQAGSLQLNHQDNVAIARHARLEIAGVPLVYLPWMRFPLGGQRQTGLLSPSLEISDSRGFDFEQPFYWNIAPEQDATFNLRHMEKHGTMLAAEWRYLDQNYSGQWLGALINQDKTTNKNRYYANTRHHQGFQHGGILGINWHWLSDPAYFNDFGRSSSETAIQQLHSSIRYQVDSGFWKLGFLSDRFTRSDPYLNNNRSAYDRYPALTLDLENTGDKTFIDYGIKMRWEAFHHNYTRSGQRQVAEPWLELTWQSPAAFVKSHFAWQYRNYQLDDDNHDQSADIPVFSLDSGLTFDRLTESGQLQTVEPRIFYLNVPYREQDSLPLFDTQETYSDWHTLFRTNSYSGYDRMADSHHLVFAVSTRLHDASGQEKFRLGLANTRQLDTRRVYLPNEEAINNPWLLEGHWQISKKWSARAQLEWEDDLSLAHRRNAQITYRGSEQKLFNFGLREETGSTGKRKQLQLDSSWSIKVNHRMRWLGRVNYDFESDKHLDSLLGIEYQSCCWAGRVVYRKYTLNNGPDTGLEKDALMFEFELKGLSRIGRDTELILERAILGY